MTVDGQLGGQGSSKESLSSRPFAMKVVRRVVDRFGFGPRFHVGCIFGVADGSGGNLVVTRQRLCVHDADTGAGSDLVRLLTVSLDVVDEPDKTVVRELADVHVELWKPPGGRRTRGQIVAEIKVGGSGHESTQIGPMPVGNLPDQVLGVLTRARLDEELVRPRLHGAALLGTGRRAVVLLGRSGSGKSTLTVHLAAAGLLILNDEQI